MALARRGFQTARKLEELPENKFQEVKETSMESDHYYTRIVEKLVRGSNTERLEAVEMLKGRQDVLIELASSRNRKVRLACVSHLSGDPEALAELAKHCLSADSRKRAVECLKGNMDALIDIACYSAFKDARLNALVRLHREALIAVIIRSRVVNVRKAGLERLSGDTKTLLRVIEECPFRKTRAASVRMLRDDIGALCSVVLKSKHRDAKKAAISLLSGLQGDLHEDVFTEMAVISPDEKLRSLAVSKLSGRPLALRRVISATRFRDTKTIALMLYSYLVSQIKDPAVLVDIATISPYPECRSAALEMLSGRKEGLQEIAQRSKFRDTRNSALRKLAGKMEAIRAIRKNSRYRDTRHKAHRLLLEESLFEKLLAKMLR